MFVRIAAGGSINTEAAELGGRIIVALDVAGQIVTEQTANTLPGGSISVGGALSGGILITGELADLGRLLIGGVCNGTLKIDAGTKATSLIHALGGVASAGQVIITAPVSNRGDIVIGPRTDQINLPDIVYDGFIAIFGDSAGDITVRGCHATPDDLDICVCGNLTGRITLTQGGCTNQVAHSCITGCL